jgi:hypothetical protein
VERGVREHAEQFWSHTDVQTRADAKARHWRLWQQRYKNKRFSLALNGRTPAENLQANRPPSRHHTVSERTAKLHPHSGFNRDY